MHFSLASDRVLGETRFAQNTNFPVHTGLYGPPLAGFAVSGLYCLRRMARRGAATAPRELRSVNLSLIRVEPNLETG
jgi:hypothetical protein